MEYTEKTIKSTEIFDGRVVHLRVDEVELPTGKKSTRELIRHPGGVGVVAVDDQNHVLMVRQYRKPLEQTLLEIPAGKLEAGEDPKECAARELEEETGYCAKNFTYLDYFIPTPGYCDEKIHIYLAKDLYQGNIHPDEDEILNVERYPLEQLIDMIAAGDLKDGKTIIGLLKYQFLQNK